MNLNVDGFSHASTTLRANSFPPSPPLLHTSDSANDAPNSSHFFATSASSFSVSFGNLFIATTTGSPYFCMFSMCLMRLGIPASSAERSSVLSSVFFRPPCIFNALTVATTTTASGFNPATRHFMSRNFSAPKSAPNPASVTR